ncbi:hypothetical protein [Arthrobacter sp. JUb115]|uniref:hypothetical protein n=1 Tax=Arthrobacter sp. JUb115 TaxID=2485108 RepID=UPI00105D9537|nr:hypothetical protein [Arthrobacter sp. JUb115]TDU21726.1 hypothetical protein EDF61_11141 [Arthrobacter sp. JUb115]
MSVVASLTAALIPVGEFDRALVFFDRNFLLVVGLWIMVVVVTARIAGRWLWDAAMMALALGTILAATINWDMLAVTFLAGVLIGLGTTLKVFTLLFLGAVIVLAIVSGR